MAGPPATRGAFPCSPSPICTPVTPQGSCSGRWASGAGSASRNSQDTLDLRLLFCARRASSIRMQSKGVHRTDLGFPKCRRSRRVTHGPRLAPSPRPALAPSDSGAAVWDRADVSPKVTVRRITHGLESQWRGGGRGGQETQAQAVNSPSTGI